MKLSLVLAFLIPSFSFAMSSGVSDPPYCSLEAFHAHEVSAPKWLMRGRAFRFGSTIMLVGGIGESESSLLVSNAKQLSYGPEMQPQEHYCTWYFNDGNERASRTFNHRYLPNPNVATYMLPISPAGGIYAIEQLAEIYSRVATPVFSNSAVNFMSCLENHKYLAFGCDGQRHRGPTVFAMLLAYSGCSPRASVNIAVALWGKNWVLNSTREWIARRAYQQGSENPMARQKWQSYFEQP